MTGHIVVLGSVNLDVSVRCGRLPLPGETLLADFVERSGGGKGANQAVAAARAGGAHTRLIGAVGADPEGDLLLRDMARDGIDVAGVRRLENQPTGLALITVDAHGENTIVVVAGANAEICLSDRDRETIADSDVVLAQLEIPQTVVAEAARGRRSGAPFVLNAAPSAPLEPALLDEIDVLVVNEHEAVDLAQEPRLEAALTALLDLVPAVLVTRGADGATLRRRSAAELHVPAPVVAALDTVAAGDTFCGVYASALAAGLDDTTCLRWACAAASLAVQRPGAQASVPTAAETAQQLRAVYG